ncbi:related to oxidoreductase [Rhynchosporium graminicola]|uniref:Related to oxidoreductase n=1 Tax=Rhynchosporium graminicola TaxID=2792576 RepID=A0A1E1KGZ7_9HELO|nr:related to oxidoreductase [Rhynchosporium commune]
MAPKTLAFKCALVTGGGGGIGLAMSKHLISLDIKVIIVGRTEKTLAEAAKELGNDTVYYVLDTGNIPAIQDFCQKVIQEHPEVDCLINNAAVQKPLDINKFDLESADQEIDINIRGPMHLTIGFLEHFKSKPAATIMNISSLLGYIPTSIINPVYNATKAWMHFWTMNLRTQLANDERGKNIKVVEIAPPTVATNLHRDREDPDDNKKENNKKSLSLPEFMEFVAKGWKKDQDTIGAGMAQGVVAQWYETFGQDYEEAEKSTAPPKKSE